MKKNNTKISKVKKKLKEKTPFYKKIWFYFMIIIAVLFFFFIIPIIINELYKLNKGYITVWSAADVLSFYAEILSGIITIVALIITIYFGKKDTEKQIKGQMSQSKMPFFVIDNVQIDKNKSMDYDRLKHVWGYSRKIPPINQSSEKDKESIEISMINIGDGVAFFPKYKDFYNCSSIRQHIESRKTTILKYDFLTELKYALDNNEEIHKSNIVIEYKNSFNILFEQIIEITIEINKNNNMASLFLKENLPQPIY